MRRSMAVALALFALTATSARGQGSKSVPLPRPGWAKASAPKGWNQLPGLAKSVSTTLEQSQAFGELRGRAGAQAFAQPGTGAFYLSWLVADKPAPDAAQVLRVALDSVRHSRVAASASSTEELKYSEAVNDNMAEASLEWRHLSNETMSLVRALAWVSPQGAPRLLKAECVVSTTDGKPPAAVESACREALASLSAGVPAGERGALGALPGGAPAPAPEEIVPPGDAPPPGQRPPDTVGPPPPGDQKILYTGPPDEPGGDSMSRWFVILGGALLIVGLYLTYRARARAAATPVAEAVTTAEAKAKTATSSDEGEGAGNEEAEPEPAPAGEPESAPDEEEKKS